MRSWLGLASLLLLLLPGVGRAQPLWGQQQGAPLSLVPEASAEANEPFGRRVGSEVLLGSLIGVGGVFGGALVGAAIAESVTCGLDDCMDGVRYVGMGAVTGVALTAPIGVYLAGQFARGEGLFLPTLAGSVAAGGVTALLLASSSSSVSGVGALVLVVSPLAGSIIGYEVSHALESKKHRTAGSDVQVIPTAGVTPSGTSVFGLVGRF